MAYLGKIFSGGFSDTLFVVFIIAFTGYLLGAIKVKGVNLGTAGVFLMALVFGHFGLADGSLLHQIGLIHTAADILKPNFKLIQNIGLICFVTAVGFIAGPSFFHDLKRNVKSYVLIGAIVIGLGALSCVGIILFTKVDAAMAVGLLSGSLTTTPGFAAAQDVVAGNEYLINEVTVGHGVAYPLGVVGVVLFVQIIPKLLKANMAVEREKVAAGLSASRTALPKNLWQLDPFGFCAFSFAVILGILVGKVSLPLPGGASFALGNTGGALIAALILSHLGHIGKISLQTKSGSMQTMREFGLVFFLIGAGVPGGSGFVTTIQEQGVMLFVYGAIMTILPMVGGYLFARYVLKLNLLNSLGSITGGMTSTPALGTLISVAETDDVASAYAATYPVALVLIVLASKFIMTLMQ